MFGHSGRERRRRTSSPLASGSRDDGAAIDVGGHDVANSKKWRDPEATSRAAIVIDDLETIDPWTARGIEVRASPNCALQAMIKVRSSGLASGMDPDRSRERDPAGVSKGTRSPPLYGVGRELSGHDRVGNTPTRDSCRPPLGRWTPVLCIKIGGGFGVHDDSSARE